MEAVLRGLVVYVFLLVVFRLAGKRTLAEASPFELVLLLIISETTQEAMIDGDHSMTQGFLLILTLVGTSILLSFLKVRFPAVERWLEGMPVVIVEDGRLHRDRMARARVGEDDLLVAARQQHGLETMAQIKHAVLEANGKISIIPRN